MANNRNNTGFGETKVEKHKVSVVKIYEVTESELDSLERGNQSDLYLEFSIACLSIFITLIVTLFTASFDTLLKSVIFICASIIFFVFGVLLLFMWYRSRASKTQVIKTIRNRGK